MAEFVDKFNRGDFVSAGHLNKIVNAVRRRLVSDGSIKIRHTSSLTMFTANFFKGWWLGRVATPGVESDATGFYYAVEREKISMSDTAYISDIDFVQDTFPSDAQEIVVNLPEVLPVASDATHYLESDRLVIVFEVKDTSVPNVSRYVMSEQAQGTALIAISDAHSDWLRLDSDAAGKQYLSHRGARSGGHAWTVAVTMSSEGGKDGYMAFDDCLHLMGWWDKAGTSWYGASDFDGNLIAEPTSNDPIG